MFWQKNPYFSFSKPNKLKGNYIIHQFNFNFFLVSTHLSTDLLYSSHHYKFIHIFFSFQLNLSCGSCYPFMFPHLFIIPSPIFIAFYQIQPHRHERNEKQHICDLRNPPSPTLKTPVVPMTIICFGDLKSIWKLHHVFKRMKKTNCFSSAKSDKVVVI